MPFFCVCNRILKLKIVNTMKMYEMPKQGDTFFMPDSGGEKTYASINRVRGLNHDHAHFLISEGYREASKILLGNIMESEQRDWLAIDSLIYPILFNFRHYLEITIKATTRNYYIMTPGGFCDDVGFMSEHSLVKLWMALKPHLHESYGHESYGESTPERETIEAAQALLQEFDRYDAGSYTFRYPYAKGKAHETLKYAVPPLTINLDNLRDMFEKCIYYFDSIYWRSAEMLDVFQTIGE